MVHPKRPRESSPAKFKVKFVLFLKSKEMVQARINLALVGEKKQAALRASLHLMLLISDLSIQIIRMSL